MKTAAIAGASGLVGSELLRILLESDKYDKVIALVRNLLPLDHPKLVQQQVDFENPDTLITGADDVYSCLGTTIAKAGSKPAFIKVDYEFPLALAKISLKHGASGFFIVSSMGSDPNSGIFYARVKGELDRDLEALGFKALGIFRPSMLLGPRAEFRLGEKIWKGLMIGLDFMIPAKWKAVQARDVARAMYVFANSGKHGTHIIPNQEIRPSGLTI